MTQKSKSTKDEMVPVYTPALSSLLFKREKEKGAPLTEEEVLDIRDNSTIVMMKASAVQAMAESRGYADIDPDKAWEQWAEMRLKLHK